MRMNALFSWALYQSDSDHWMFISSNGGISAGRKDADHATFPYYTDDKITDSAEFTGVKPSFLSQQNEQMVLWEPFFFSQQRLVFDQQEPV